MKTIHFQKWQGAGNDFVIIDNRNQSINSINPNNIKLICDRHFGIGGDGLMLIEKSKSFDFEMIYYNSDGFPAAMCGNGGRCIAAMAAQMGIFDRKTTFLASDGVHEAEIIDKGWIRLKMKSVDDYSLISIPNVVAGSIGKAVFLNTGVPHLVVIVNQINSVEVDIAGRILRNLKELEPSGANVNFVQISDQVLNVRTYERGVEGETFACGTGNVAAAIATEIIYKKGLSEYQCMTLGGPLKVSFNREGNKQFNDVWLEGPAVKVFEGTIEKLTALP
jgi:diaminopimelate epimerase